MASDDVDLNALDLNLLVALDALLEERSVSRAATRLRRSQPALSAALKRLRRQFRDDLLTRVGNTYELTPLATQLKSRTSLVVADVERLFATRATFDAPATDREFTIVGSDYASTVVGTVLAELLHRVAPSARLRFTPVTDEIVGQADEALRSVDGLLLPHGYLRLLPSVDIHKDRWVGVVDAANEEIGERLTFDQLPALRWVIPFSRAAPLIAPARQLQSMGVDVRVEVAVESFSVLPHFVEGTGRVAVVQERLADRIVDRSRLRVVSLPVEVPLFEAFWWHPTLEQDPGHQWLRARLREVGRIVERGRAA
ncbi:MAG: LysR family transcriptional regulator [Actinomycetota bacterium]|nr:LysR family transcriptional regulator [Actinomycetota bacterium]